MAVTDDIYSEVRRQLASRGINDDRTARELTVLARDHFAEAGKASASALSSFIDPKLRENSLVSGGGQNKTESET
jgi:hypothetical protein